MHGVFVAMPEVVLHVLSVLATHFAWSTHKLQLVSSLSTSEYCPAVQASHTVDVDEFINVPGGQHPKRPVDVK